MSIYSTPRATSPQVPRFSDNSSLGVPSLATPNPVSPGAQRAARLAQALGLTSDMIAGTAAMVGQQMKADQREQDALDTALAHRHGRQVFSQLQDQILNRQLLAPDGADIGEFATSMAEQQAEGHSKAYKQAFVNFVSPLLTESFIAEQRRMRRESIDDGMALFGDEAISVSTVEDLNRIDSEAKSLDPTMSEVQRLAKIFIPAGREAAMAGDLKRTNAILDFLGDRLPAVQQELRLNLKDAVDKRMRDESVTTRNQIIGMFNDGIPPDDIRNAIQQKREKLGNDFEPYARSLLNSLNAMSAGQDNALARQQAQAVVRAAMDSADSTGGASIVDDITVNGHTFTRNDLIETETNRAMMAFQQNAASPELALGEQVKYLSDNGVIYQPWKRIMDAGRVAALSTPVNASKDGKLPPLPANVAAGYNLYKRIGSMNPRLRDLHIDQSTQRFYRGAELAEKYITIGDPQKALEHAARIESRDPLQDPLANRIDAERFASALNDAIDKPWPFTGSAENISDVAGTMATIARSMIHAYGIDPKVAVDEAKKRVLLTHTFINGWLVDTHDKQVPANINDLAQTAITTYVQKYGYQPISEDSIVIQADFNGMTVKQYKALMGSATQVGLGNRETIDPSDLTLVPGETSGTWVLFNKTTRQPVDRWREKGVGSFTNADLARMNVELKRQLANDVSAEAKAERDRILQLEAQSDGLSYPQLMHRLQSGNAKHRAMMADREERLTGISDIEAQTKALMSNELQLLPSNGTPSQ